LLVTVRKRVLSLLIVIELLPDPPPELEPAFPFMLNVPFELRD